MTDWKTTLSGAGVAISSALATLALVPYDTGMQYIPEPWRSRLIIIGGLSAFILRIIQGKVGADSK